MEFIFLLKVLKGVCSLPKLLIPFLRTLRTNDELIWLRGEVMFAAGAVKLQMTPHKLVVDRVPKLRKMVGRFGEAVLHYMFSVFFGGVAFFLLMLGRLQWEQRPLMSMLILAVALIPALLCGTYARFGNFSREALNREWAKHQKSWESYAAMGSMSLVLPLVAYLYEIAPQVILGGMA